MRKNISSIIILVYIFVLASCKSNQNEKAGTATLTQDQLQKIDSICQSFLDKGNTVGFSVAIAHKDKTVFSKGYGITNLVSKDPATENTIYPIASISKFITAVTTMKMVEENKLSLQDKVIDHIPEFPRQQYMNEITIEHLLRHQSGLVDHENWFDSIYINEKRVFTDKEFLTFIDQPLFFQPGSRYSYSNSGYAILSNILEKVSGLSMHDLIVKKIGIPTGMESLGMWPIQWDKKNATMGYELKNGGKDTSFHMMTKGMKGDGGLSASVSDLLKLFEAITEKGFLTTSSLEKILSPSQMGSISIDYGLGVKIGNVGGEKTWGHSGGYSGTGWAIVAHYQPSGFTFAAAINTSFSPEDAWMLRHKIMPVVLNLDIPVMDTAAIANIDLYTGKYVAINRWNDGNASVRIVTNENGKLVWDNPVTERPGIPLYPIADHTFSWEPFPYDEFKFHIENGKVIACSEYIDGFFVGVRLKQ